MKITQIFEKVGVSVSGLDYEYQVASALRQGGIGRHRKEITGFNSYEPDQQFVIDGKRYFVEIKKNTLAQMGGTSVRYNPRARSVRQSFHMVRHGIADNAALDSMTTALLSKQMSLNDLIAFLRDYPSNTGVNASIAGFPMAVTRKSWHAAKRAGLLQAINVSVDYDAAFIRNHYRQKGIYYIQIGKLGAFYLTSNPAKLPLPQLRANVRVEIRAATGGFRQNSGSTEQIVSALLRVQARLLYSGKSPYTFDDPASITQMLSDRG